MIQFVYPSTLILKLICINDISSLSKFMEICKQGETLKCMMQFLSRELNKYWRLNGIYCNVLWSSLFYNTSARHERQECDASATRVRNFDFDNDTNENIFPNPYIGYMANERLRGEEQFHSKNYVLEMPHSYAKMHLKSALQKLNFVMAKAISKSYTLDCSCKCHCTFPHSCA